MILIIATAISVVFRRRSGRPDKLGVENPRPGFTHPQRPPCASGGAMARNFSSPHGEEGRSNPCRRGSSVRRSRTPLTRTEGPCEPRGTAGRAGVRFRLKKALGANQEPQARLSLPSAAGAYALVNLMPFRGAPSEPCEDGEERGYDCDRIWFGRVARR